MGQSVHGVASHIRPFDFHPVQIPKNAVHHAAPIPAFDAFGEFDGFVHGGGNRDSIQIPHLIGAETEDSSHDCRQPVKGTTRHGVQLPIQRRPVAEYPVHQLKSQGLVFV